MTIPLLEAAVWLLVAVLWWMFYWPYRQFQIDRTRQRLFVIRVALFDAAARGEHIRFEDRAYGMTRTSLNGMLRSLDDFTLIRLVFLVWQSVNDQAWRETRDQYANEMEAALEELSAEGREFVTKTIHDACRAMLVCVIETSLVLLALYILIAMLRPIRFVGDSIRVVWRRLIGAMDYESSLAGRDDLRSFGGRAAT